jgi:hypothetical protein
MRQFDNKDDEIEDKKSKMVSAIMLSKEINQEFALAYNERLKQIIDYNQILQKLKNLGDGTVSLNGEKV